MSSMLDLTKNRYSSQWVAENAAGDPPPGDYASDPSQWSREMCLWFLRHKGFSAGTIKNLSELQKSVKQIIERSKKDREKLK